jgi:hypothetical protein
MKGKYWKFTKTLPTEDSIDASIVAYSSYRKACEECDLAPNDVDVFMAGFYRGMKWQEDKDK